MKKPNIILPFNDKKRINDLILNVINETWINTYPVDSIELNGQIFTLTLTNKKFVFETMQVDNLSDYVDVYLQGIKINANTYSVSFNELDIIITFNQSVTRTPSIVSATDFTIKGKIVMNDISYRYIEIAQGFGLTTENFEDIII
jgi:hypothetical protein